MDKHWSHINHGSGMEEYKVVQGIVITGFIFGFLLVILRICSRCLNYVHAESDVVRPVHGGLNRPYAPAQQSVPQPNNYPFTSNNEIITSNNNFGRNYIPVAHSQYLPSPRCINMSDVSRVYDPPPPYFPGQTVPPYSQSISPPPYSSDSK